MHSLVACGLCCRSVGPVVGSYLNLLSNVWERKALLSVESATGLIGRIRPRPRPRLISFSVKKNITEIKPRPKILGSRLCGQLHKNSFISINNPLLFNNNNERFLFYSTDKNSNLLERFQNDPEAKSLMQELWTDFEQPELITEEEKTIIKENLGFEPMLNRSDRMKNPGEKNERFCSDQHQVSELSDLILDKDYVFNIGEMVEMLEEENARDVCVIQLPKKIRYADYMVLSTGRSTRHLKAMAEHFNKRYKEMKSENHPFLTIEGKNTDDWMCIDFGNIVLHFMLEETREIYELEKLWTLGPEFDDQSQRMNVYDMRMFNADLDLKGKQEDTID